MEAEASHRSGSEENSDPEQQKHNTKPESKPDSSEGELTKEEFKEALRSDAQRTGSDVDAGAINNAADVAFNDLADKDTGKIQIEKLADQSELKKLQHADANCDECSNDPPRDGSAKEEQKKENQQSDGQSGKADSTKKEGGEPDSTKKGEDSAKKGDGAPDSSKKEENTPKKKKSKQNKRLRKALRYCHLNPNVVVWAIIYILANCLIFPAGLWTIKDAEKDAFSWGIYLAKCFRMVIYLNVPILFLLMCRYTLGWLRKSRHLFVIFPFDSAITFHRVVAWVLLFAAVGHTIGHYKDFYVISHTPVNEINEILKTPLDGPKSWAGMLFGTMSGITGHIMIFSFAILYPAAFFRRKQFEIFYFTHYLWLVVIVCLLIHGTKKLVTMPIFYIIFAAPGLLFFSEQFYRFIRTKFKMEAIEAKSLHDGVTLLRLKKDKRFNYKSGQYVSLNCRDVAVLTLWDMMHVAAHTTNILLKRKLLYHPYGSWKHNP
eukprot:TRINITY_DN3814_c0_g1_i4.p1 TRINITY_DN3814_c0_g1~~TRINITY_DN3814_c0_g1_i4.p1  ORF type:complete len:509 (+),score=112.15 TRINITY_DN3814_c0_g1_i4:62-1528(+)